MDINKIYSRSLEIPYSIAKERKNSSLPVRYLSGNLPTEDSINIVDYINFAQSVGWINGVTGGSSSFVGLTDTPSAFGTSGQILQVNAAGNGLEFVNSPVVNVTGVTDQTNGLDININSGNIEISPDYTELTNIVTIDNSNDRIMLYDNDGTTHGYITPSQIAGATYTASTNNNLLGIDVTGTGIGLDIQNLANLAAPDLSNDRIPIYDVNGNINNYVTPNQLYDEPNSINLYTTSSNVTGDRNASLNGFDVNWIKIGGTGNFLMTKQASATGIVEPWYFRANDDSDIWAPANNWYGLRSDVFLSGTPPNGISTARRGAFLSNILVQDGGSYGPVWAAYNLAYHDGTGTVDNLSGLQALVRQRNAGTVNNLFGVKAELAHNAQLGSGLSTTNNMYNFSANLLANPTGTINTHYMFYGNAANTSIATNKWGLYISDEDYFNYTGGALNVGATTKRAMLYVQNNNNSNNAANPVVDIAASDGTSNFIISENGNINFPKHINVASFLGTPTHYFGMDIAGNLIKQPIDEVFNLYNSDNTIPANTTRIATLGNASTILRIAGTTSTDFENNGLKINGVAAIGGVGLQTDVTLGIRKNTTGTVALDIYDSAVAFRHRFYVDAGNHARVLFRHGTDTTRDVQINTNGDSWFRGGNFGIGTNGPSQALHVEGSIRMVDGNEGAGKIATSDATGVITWVDGPQAGTHTTASGAVETVNFPVAFAAAPTAVVATGENTYQHITNITATGFDVVCRDIVSTAIAGTFTYIAYP